MLMTPDDVIAMYYQGYKINTIRRKAKEKNEFESREEAQRWVDKIIFEEVSRQSPVMKEQ